MSDAVKCYLIAHKNIVSHTITNGGKDNTSVVVRSMNHLAVSNVNAGMTRIYNDVSRLRIGHTSPAHKRNGGAQTAITTGEAVANESRAVKAVRTNAAPGISATKLAVGTRNNGAAVNGLAWRRRGRCCGTGWKSSRRRRADFSAYPGRPGA